MTRPMSESPLVAHCCIYGTDNRLVIQSIQIYSPILVISDLLHDDTHFGREGYLVVGEMDGSVSVLIGSVLLATSLTERLCDDVQR